MFIAIDLATAKPLAYCGLKENESLVFYASTKKPGLEGFKEFYGKLEKMGDVQGIITEKPYLKANAKVYGQLSEMVGRLKNYCAERGIPFYEVMPAHWKRAYLGKIGIRASDKQADNILNNIVEMVVFLNFYPYKIPPTSPDVRDCILFGLYQLRRINSQKKTKST